MIQLALLLILVFSCGPLHADFKLNMPYGVTTLSHEIYSMHMATFWVCFGIGMITYSFLFYSLIRFRKSKGAKPYPFRNQLTIEMIWIAVPFIILCTLAAPASIILKHIHNTKESGLTIKITGYQWKWRYEYLEHDLSFFSNLSTSIDQINNNQPKGPWFLREVDHPLIVPINTKIKILITSDDVIHSWWVPEFGIKQDAIPGYINENWIYITTPGIYRGQCGELCGINHAFMPVVVEAISTGDFEKWLHLQNQQMRRC